MRLATLVVLSCVASGCLGLSGNPGADPDTAPPGRPLTWAEKIVWAQPATRLVVEIDYEAGREPGEVELEAMADLLLAETDKESVEILKGSQYDAQNPNGDDNWTFAEVWAIHQASLDLREPGADVVALHVLALGAHYAPDGRPTAGFQWENLIALFPDVHGDTEALPHPGIVAPPYTTIRERRMATLLHETGHALGLVNNGAPMLTDRLPPVEDDPCRCHSTRPESIMCYCYDDVRSPRRFAETGQWIPMTLDDYDRADLAALRQAGRDWWAESGRNSPVVD